jgi:signal transduction histidine kinase
MAHRGVSDANSALRRINEILEEQVQRIARELHDDAGQLLASVHLALHEVGRDLAPSSRQRLQDVRGLLDRIEEQLRRISHELRPLILDDLGLVPAIQFLGDGVSRRAGIAVIVKGSTEERLPPVVETALYRIVQEALNNAARHAQASRVTVTLLHEDGQIRCSIRDDGIGLPRAPEGARPAGRGLGLIGIRERIAPLSGTLEIQSGERKGTELLVTIPLETIRA